jgi:LytTr DNA-binding domain-containing protein
MLLKNKLAQLYPIHTFPAAVRRDAILSIITAVFLLAFKPFGLDQAYTPEKSYLILGFGVVTFITLFINELLGYKGLSRQFTEAKWTIRSQLLWLIWRSLSLGLTNFLYAVFTGTLQLSFSQFIRMQVNVTLCGILPIAFLILFWQNHLLKRNLAEALELNRDIVHPTAAGNAGPPETSATNSELLRFTGENKDELLELPGNALYYMVSQDNYVEFVWEEKGNVKRALLRSTLSSVEEILTDRPSFFRSHRAYVVNLSKVSAVEGNAQGYTLELPGIGAQIPVSRGRGKELNRLLKEGKAVQQEVAS